MGFGTIELTTVSRAQDYTTVKHNEDVKAFVDQTNIGHQTQQMLKQRATTVVDGEKTEWQNKRHDAREKGANEYVGDGGKNRSRNKAEKSIDRMVIKGRESFDIKI